MGASAPVAGACWVGGARWTAGPPATIRSPWDGAVVGTMPTASWAEADRALAAAEAAFREWRMAPAGRRADACAQVAAGLRERRDAFAGLICAEAGKPIQYARAEVDRAARVFALAAEEATRLPGEVIPVDQDPRTVGYTALARRVPIGVVVAITPFNFPLNLLAHKVAPALAAGNTVVAKPAPQAPLTASALAELVHAADVPAGALNVLHLPVADAERLVTDPRPAALSFTGSDRVGWALKAKAGKKRVLLELGGNAAAIVHADADLDWAAERCAVGAFAYAGQVCISLQRLLVHAPVYDAFVARLLARTRALPVGDPTEPATVIGPMIDDAAADRVAAWVARARAAGATVLHDGGRKGRVLGPIVLAGVDPREPVACDEAFGPVLCVDRYDDFAEAVARADASRFGLQGAVFTHDLRRIAHAFDHWQLGGLIVNDFPMLRADHLPYGGTKDSGLGREGVRYAIEALTEWRTMLARVAPPP